MRESRTRRPSNGRGEGDRFEGGLHRSRALTRAAVGSFTVWCLTVLGALLWYEAAFDAGVVVIAGGVATIIGGAMVVAWASRRVEVTIFNEYITGLRQAYDQAVELSKTDDLTGLPNRRSFMHELGRRIDGQPVAGDPLHVIFLDLDGLKDFNDEFGHAVGDEVLRQVAGHFRRLVDGKGFAARVGGDEFVVAVSAQRRRAVDLARALSRCRLALDDRLVAAGCPLSVSATYGVASCDGPGASVDEVLAAADQDMYRRRNRKRRAA